VIASLRGTVLDAAPDAVILDVGGVGYAVTPSASALRLAGDARGRGEPVVLVTHLQVREDLLQLYGFADVGERRLFEMLIGVSKVGPKVALALVSALGTDRLRTALATGDAALLASVRGVGKSIAQRLVVELREKVGALAVTARSSVPVAAAAPTATDAAREALVALGMSPLEAEVALAGVDGDLPVEERVRRALASATLAAAVP
jgi:holliday junction DNA helicase RuvA